MNTQVIGFGNKDAHKVDRENLLQYITHKDLKAYGLIPEIIGRLPVLTYLEPLDEDALRRIITEPKNAIIKQYKKLFEIEGIDLTFTEEAISFIAAQALEYKLGARGLRSICEAIMMDAMYELPSQKDITSFEVTKAYAQEKLGGSKLSKLRVA